MKGLKAIFLESDVAVKGAVNGFEKGEELSDGVLRIT